MRRTLTSIILAGTLGLSFLSRAENYQLNFPEGRVIVESRVLSPKEPFEERTLNEGGLLIRLKNEKTELTIIDEGNNGFDKGDKLHLSHKFSTGDILKAELIHYGDRKFKVEYTITFSEGKSTFSYKLDTKSKWWVPNFILDCFTKKVRNWGDKVYNQLHSEINNGNSPSNIPYSEYYQFIKKAETLLPRLKKREKLAFKELREESERLMKETN